MVVKADYEARTLDDLAEEALEIVERWPGIRCGHIGDKLFAGHAHLNGSAPYARIAGKVMRKLEREGKAVETIMNGRLGWCVK